MTKTRKRKYMNWKRHIPILEWLPNYKKAYLKSDLSAGLTVAIMLVPQGMAYALLAGMPPIYGLYAGLIPLILYAVLGTSRHLSVGPVALSALLVWAGISRLDGVEEMSDRYIELVILTGLLIGMVHVLMGYLKLGFFVNFLSHPVLAGFTSAAAIIISVSQLKHLLGIDIPRYEHSYETLEYVFWNLELTNVPTLILGVISIVIIQVFKKWKPKFPRYLLVVVLGILVSYWLNLHFLGVAIIGHVPEGLPAFGLPVFDYDSIKLVLPTVLTVSIMGVVECISIAKALESKHRDYIVYPNQELKAIGWSKIGGALFQALPTSGSFSRSAINSFAGGKTALSSIITALLIGLTLLFFTHLFFYLPKSVLAAIIFVAIIGLFDFKEAKHLWKIHRQDFSMMMTTFFVTLIFGIEYGILVGVILSIFLVIYRTTQPHIAILGNIPGTPAYRNIQRFPKATETEGILIIRMDASLYFGNADYFKSAIRREVRRRDKSLKMVLLDASSFHEIDSSGLHAVTELIEELQEQNIEFYLSGAIGPVRDLLMEAEFSDLIGEQRQFMYVDHAMKYYAKERANEETNWHETAVQANKKQISKIRRFFSKIRGN
jgi:SulP family sulfate permease